MHGRVLALQTALIGGTALVGGPIVGQIADIAGGRAPLAVGGWVPSRPASESSGGGASRLARPDVPLRLTATPVSPTSARVGLTVAPVRKTAAPGKPDGCSHEPDGRTRQA